MPCTALYHEWGWPSSTTRESPPSRWDLPSQPLGLPCNLQMADAVEAKAESLVTFRMIALKTDAAREALIAKAHELRSALLAWVADTWQKDNQAIVTKWVHPWATCCLG